MDLDDIRENYAKFDNEKLIKLATEEIKSLRKEVIPILVAELAKRNISITKKNQGREEKKSQEQTTSEKTVMSQITEFMNEFETPHILKVGKRYFVNTPLLFVISILFTIIFLLLFKSLFGTGIRLIFYGLITSILITIALRKLSMGKIVDIKPNSVNFSKYPNINFGVFRIFVLFQIGLNAINKKELKYKNISRIYQKNDITDKGFYIETKDNITEKDFRIFLEVLSENDRKQVLEVVKIKISEEKNVA